MRGAALAACLATIITTSCAASADEIVSFDSARYVVGTLQQRLARERGEAPPVAPASSIKGYLAKPEGAGPFPAVVHLHGCMGLTERLRQSSAARITEWGYVSLVVDSFATRNIADDCVSAPMDRHADAIGALTYLASLPYVDPQRIALIGYAHGGNAALQVASERPYRLFDMPADLAYRAVITYYPRCNTARLTLSVPALILIGELDDWSPIKLCEWWMQRRAGRGADVRLVVYPEAFHGFDDPGIRNGMDFVFSHWLKYDAKAADQAQTEVRKFLADNFAK